MTRPVHGGGEAGDTLIWRNASGVRSGTKREDEAPFLSRLMTAVRQWAMSRLSVRTTAIPELRFREDPRSLLT
jgi:hypothetical protein